MPKLVKQVRLSEEVYNKLNDMISDDNPNINSVVDGLLELGEYDGRYHIAYGVWDVGYKIKNGKLVATHYMKQLDGAELIAVSEKEYKSKSGR